MTLTDFEILDFLWGINNFFVTLHQILHQERFSAHQPSLLLCHGGKEMRVK